MPYGRPRHPPGSMAFSGAVKIGDLNDFIAPSQACVVSLEGGKLAAASDAEVRQKDPEGGSRPVVAGSV